MKQTSNDCNEISIKIFNISKQKPQKRFQLGKMDSDIVYDGILHIRILKKNIKTNFIFIKIVF